MKQLRLIHHHLHLLQQENVTYRQDKDRVKTDKERKESEYISLEEDKHRKSRFHLSSKKRKHKTNKIQFSRNQNHPSKSGIIMKKTLMSK